MTVLGLEISDVGIMVAGGKPARLLEVDGYDHESPGFALPERNLLIVGKAAQKTARLDPRLYSDRFWDELGTDPLKQPGLEVKNNAELAYAHLERIWGNIKRYGSELAISVPGFFKQEQLGLILGITRELSIPVRGFATTAIAASMKPYPNHLLFNLDIHLHRIEITFLEQNDQLLQKNMETIPGKGVSTLYAEWVKAIADEFVRTTRFDPFDQAIYEQELYNRLPSVLRELKEKPSMMFELRAGAQAYRVNLTYDLLVQKAEGLYREIRKLIEEMREKYGKPDMPLVLEVTHRVNALPGCRDEINRIPNMRANELKTGSGAFGVLDIQDHFAVQKTGQGVAFLTSRPLQTDHIPPVSVTTTDSQNLTRPTHIRCGNFAYPISSKPLIIGRGLAKDTGVRINEQAPGVSRKHCTIQLKGNDILLINHSTDGTFVNGEKVSGTAVLNLGEIIQVGTQGEELQLIACVESNET